MKSPSLVTVVVLGVFTLCRVASGADPQAARGRAADPPSQSCADSVTAYWEQAVLERPKTKTPGDERWSYDGHYNRQLKKCLMSIRLMKIFGDGLTTTREEAFVMGDMSAGPIAGLYTRSDGSPAVLLKANVPLSYNPVNLAWFKALMTD